MSSPLARGKIVLLGGLLRGWINMIWAGMQTISKGIQATLQKGRSVDESAPCTGRDTVEELLAKGSGGNVTQSLHLLPALLGVGGTACDLAPVNRACGGAGGNATDLRDGPCQRAGGHALRWGDLVQVSADGALDVVVAGQLDGRLRRNLDHVGAVTAEERARRAWFGTPGRKFESRGQATPCEIAFGNVGIAECMQKPGRSDRKKRDAKVQGRVSSSAACFLTGA